jgi:hypothetical protein
MNRRKPRKWDLAAEDPTAGLINLFDVWMVFAVVLLLALVQAGVVRSAASATETISRVDAQGNLEIVERDGVKVTKMRLTRDSLSGEGERLGIAYRLKSGEVVYVPSERQADRSESP